MRGAAHIGVLKVLEAERIPVDYIAGTSAGSIIAALYACGYPPSELEQLATRLRAPQVFDPVFNLSRVVIMGLKVALDCLNVPSRWLPKPPLGLIRGARLERWVHRLTNGKTFNETDIPLAIIAVDLNTGREVVFGPESARKPLSGIYPTALMAEDEPVSLAVRASTAIPVVFLPRRYGEMNLVDGGITNNVPADALKAWGADVVIAVDLEFANSRGAEIDNVLEVVMQTIDIMGQEITSLKLAQHADVVIRPGIYDAGLMDFHRIPELIAGGERATREALPRIRELLSRGP
jgi:NTE family protein